MTEENYWKEKYADVHLRLTNRIARLEQENKKLRKANEISIEKVTVTAEAKRLQELEQENKELKAIIKHQCYKCRIGDTTEDKLRYALEEIREIVKESIEISYNLKVNSMLYDITHKINEGLGGN